MLPQYVANTLKVIAGIWLALAVIAAALLFLDALSPPQVAFTFFPVTLPPSTAIFTAVLTLVSGVLTWAVLMALGYLTEFAWLIYLDHYPAPEPDID